MCAVENETFDVEFIQRTLDNLDSDNKPAYEVTMLINSLVGLVIIPSESGGRRVVKVFLKNISDEPVIKTLMQDAYFCPTHYDRKEKVVKPKQLTISNLLMSVRNSIAHHRIYCLPEDGKWRRVRICDINERNTKEGKPHLELSIDWTIAQLREFCNFICKAYLKEAKSKPEVRLLPLETWRSDC